MSLEFVILGWLETGPGSGYDLVRQMDRGLAWFWTAPHSQIYPVLRRMEDKGLIASSAVTVGEKQEKRVYEITESGREAVRQWAGEPVRYPPNRDVQRLKLIFGDHGDVGTVRRHLEDHQRHYERRKEQLEHFYDELVQHRHERIERRIAASPDPTRRELIRKLREFAYRGDITRAEGEIAWVKDVLQWLGRFEAETAPTTSATADG